MPFVKFPNSKKLKKELNAKKLDSIYLFMGEEEGEKEKFINKIIDLVFKDNKNKGNNTGRFHIENDEFLSAADFALSQSLFLPEKVCIMLNIDRIGSNKNDVLIFKEMLETIPDFTILIMTTAGNRPPGFIGSNDLKKIKVVQFWRYFDEDIYHYIEMNFKKLQIRIDDDAVNLLIELTGNDIKKIDDAIDMIKYSGETGIINSETIKYYINDVKSISVFNLVDSLYKKEKSVLKLLKKLIDEGTQELFILAMIQRQADIIEKYFSLIDSGMSSDEAVKSCGVYSRNRMNFIEHVKQFSPGKVKKLFPLISFADLQIKSRGITKDFLSNPIYNLVAGILFEI